MNSEWIDITYSISNVLPKWPGSIGFEATWNMNMPENPNNSSQILLDCHFGTHLDEPLHFVEQGKSVDQIELSKLIGEAYVVEISGVRSITSHHLENAGIPKSCKRILIKTDNQKYWIENKTTFQENFCSIDKSGAEWIVKRGIVLVGIDYLSIQRFNDNIDTHVILLSAEVVIVETLNLQEVIQGWFELICLPIKLKGLEGAPVRALLRRSDINEN